MTTIVKFSFLNVTADGNNKFISFPTSGIYYVFQTDGNFVAYNSAGFGVASTGGSVPSGSQNLLLAFQTDGNLVVYSDNGSGTALWSSNTGGIAAGADLVLQDKSPYIQIVKNGVVYFSRG